MKSLSSDHLAELEPAGIAPPDAGLQQRKSSDTRRAILEAAIDCLAEVGYARTTAQLIAKMANVSRGAMLHHYTTRQDLIEAVIDYAFFRHMEQFSTAVRSLTEEERTQENVGVQLDWRLFLSREYKAYLELNVAARTDEALRRMFLPKARRHDRVWREELRLTFPEWTGDLQRLDRSRRLVHAMMSGMALNRDIWDDRQMEAVLLGFISSALLQIREGTLRFPEP